MKRVINSSLFKTVFILLFVLTIVGLLMYKKVFSAQIPELLDHLPTSADINEKTLVSGRFNDGMLIDNDSNYLTLKYLVKMDAESFRVTLPNEFLRMEVREYDDKYNYIGITDIASLDFFTKNSNTKYLLLSFYKMNELGNKVNSSFNELNELFKEGEFKFEELKDINSQEFSEIQSTITTYLSEKTFLNVANFKPGAHASAWGAGTKYTYGTHDAASRNYYKVVPETTYYVSTTDSRSDIHVQFRNKEGNWIKSGFDWKGGTGLVSFTTPKDCVALSINMKDLGVLSKKTYTNGYELIFKYGMKLSISPNGYVFKETESTNVMPNLMDKNTWKIGAMGWTNNEYYYDPDSYCLKYFSTAFDKNITYIFHTKIQTYRLKVIEKNDANETIKETKLMPDGKFKFDSATTKYIFVLYSSESNTSYLFKDLMQSLDEGNELSFTEYVPYKHNTNMKDLTNRELLSKLSIGWNLGNVFESHASKFEESSSYWNPETYWGNPVVTEDLIKYVKSLGFNNIRIPVTYQTNFYYDDNGNFVFRKEHLARVKEIVDYAIKNDMYVVINSHFDSGYSKAVIRVGAEGAEYERAKKYAKQMWTQVAEYFKDYDEHLMFESYNEVDNPYVSRTCTLLAGTQMNELNQIFVDTVRSTGGNNEKRILQLQTFLSGKSTSILDSFVVPTDIYPNKLIAQVHSYPSAWDQKVEADFEKLDKFTARTNLPVVIGEFGNTSSFSPSAFRFTVISNYVARAKKHNVLIYLWDNGSDFRLIDRRALSVNQDYLNALFNPQEYVTENKTTINDLSQFTCGKLNQSTGEVTNKYDGWGTILSNLVPVEPNTQFLQVDLFTTGASESRNLHYVFFYDANKNFLKDQSINEGYPGFTSKLIVVPKEAKYVMFGINSSQYKTYCSDYDKWFKEGIFYLEYKFLNANIDRTIIDTPITSRQTKLNQFEDFEWGMLYTGSGEVKVNIGWGEISTPYIELHNTTDTFDYHWYTRNSCAIQVRHAVWYDANKQYLARAIDDSSQNGSNVKSLVIPEGAKYIRLGMTGLSNYRKPNVSMMFANGDCTLVYQNR